MNAYTGRLFNGIDVQEINSILTCLQARSESFKKGSVILSRGMSTDSFAVVLDGCILITQDDYWGNRNIITTLSAGDIFGEAFAAVPESRMNAEAVAETDAEVLFVDFRKLLTTCSNSCSFHNQIIRNLFSILAAKNQLLSEKLSHVSQRSTREKVMSYLYSRFNREKTDVFQIPMNRQQLADYLSVDRSALSSELSKMKKEGLIDFYKNTFKILKKNTAL